MKNILATLAIVGFASSAFAGAKDDYYKATDDLKDLGEKIESSDAKVPYPFKPFVGTIVSPVGNTIYYAAEGLDILGQVGVEKMVAAAVASGDCLEKAQHPGQAAGCAIKLGGDAVVVVWNTAGYEGANAVDYAGELLSDVAFRWRDAFGVLGDTLKASGDPVLGLIGEGAYIVKFAINAAGVITHVTAATLANGGRDFVDGVALAADAFVDVPVALLQPDLQRAGNSLVIGIGYTGCTVIDAALLPVQLIAALANATDNGNRTVEKCMTGMKRTADQIRAGTYVAPEMPAYDNKP